MTTISICTLAHGREDHLRNLVSGLNHSQRPPCELVVAVMQDHRYDLPSTSFPVRQILLGDKGICLAEARNTAAREARGDLLIFLDVDCIPAPRLVEDYAVAAAFNEGVLMGEVGYLPKGATDRGIDYAVFERLAVKHADRAGPPRGMVGKCGDYRCFWSLNFALHAATFRAIGGFDPRYVGYGGEDTDLAAPSCRRIYRCGGPRARRPITNTTSTTCRRSTISTASSPMRRFLRRNGANRPCSTGCAHFV